MKKKNKNKTINIIFMIFFISFLVVYFSELTGYYDYQNYKKTSLTKEQIREFEKDVKSGKKVDMKKYMVVEHVNYNNNLSKLASKFSEGLSDLVRGVVENTFRFLSNLIDE